MAFISPDDPIPERPVPGYISPDEPIPPRAAPTPSTAPEEGEEEDDEEGVVTGMGHDAHMMLEELTRGFDPHVIEIVHTVAKLSEALRRRGEAGLKATTDMTRFETTLRAYCLGYLAGRRAEDDLG